MEKVTITQKDANSAEFEMTMPRSLFDQLLKKANEENVTLNQYLVYVLSKAAHTK